MIDLKFGFNFQFKRDKTKDKSVDENKIEWKPVIKKGKKNGKS